MIVAFTAGKFSALDNSGFPFVGGKVWAYASPDTSTPAPTFSDVECTVLNTWPVILDARGEGFIYIKTVTDFYLTIPTAIDISAPIWESRKVGEQQASLVSVSAIPVTLNNNYVANHVPAFTSLSDVIGIILLPDVTNKDTIGKTTDTPPGFVFTGTGINDLLASGPYLGTTANSKFTIAIDSVANSIDSNILLLLHGDDLNDSEGTPKTVTAHGSAASSTDQKTLGSGSILLTRTTSDYLSLSDSDDWYLETNDFTLELRGYFADANNATFFSQSSDANNQVRWDYESGQIRFYAIDSSSVVADYKYTWVPTVNTWYYLSIVRSGSNLYLFIDGTLVTWTVITTAISTTSLPNISGTLNIGYSAITGYYFNGYLSEIVWSKGTARWTATYTPPSQEYSVNIYDTIKWRVDGGTYVEKVSITMADQTMIDGVKFKFSENTGHTLGDKWTLTVMTPARLNLDGLGNDIIYKSVGTVQQALDGGDITKGFPAHLDRAAGQSVWELINPSLPVLTNIPRKIYRREVTGNSKVTISDFGNEISYIGNGGDTLTLMPCGSSAGNPIDLVNASNFDWTIQTDPAYTNDRIITPENYLGVTSMVLGAGGRVSCRLESNGVNYHLPFDATSSVGFVYPFAGTIVPSGFLLCDGAAVSRTTYARLFAVTGTAFGTGDGSTTFNVPDCRSCFPIGVSVGKPLGDKSGGVPGVLLAAAVTQPLGPPTIPGILLDADISNNSGWAVGVDSIVGGSSSPYVAFNFIIKY